MSGGIGFLVTGNVDSLQAQGCRPVDAHNANLFHPAAIFLFKQVSPKKISQSWNKAVLHKSTQAGILAALPFAA
ncbi:hypothetical protein AXE65_01935 [Ventosimonas gracilis]|uniref:Uncharacterized protein n=2 Tax=Ventosimonas gracilis TaxID=1680762 RepID=A0A139SUT8_9GAMM|nr:hypothetical protein AXE65_01935 [Ventosimonas gracilis]